MKNLILPNIGEYQIIDDELITADDVGNNYFVSDTDIGQYRCNVTAQQLNQLNDQVKYNSISQSAATYINNTLLHTDSSKLHNTVVIITQLFDQSSLLKCADYCYSNNIPLINIVSVGLLSYARVQLRELCIVESHPTGTQYDLYIHPSHSNHFIALHQYLHSYGDINDHNKYDAHQHAHIPYIVILHYYLQKYMNTHSQQLPVTLVDRDEFKSMIRSGRWCNASGESDEANFDEAIDNYISIVNTPSIDPAVQQVLNDQQAGNITSNSENYWYCIRAIRDFIMNDTGSSHCLPVSNNIPDMHCTTNEYIHIKQLYAKQAHIDLQKITKRVHDLLMNNQRSTDDIPVQYIEYVVKNIRQVRVVRTRSISDEYQQLNIANITELLEEHNELINSDISVELQPSNIDWYIALRVYCKFIDQHDYAPGSNDELCEHDYTVLCEMAQELFDHHQLKYSVIKETLHEMYV